MLDHLLALDPQPLAQAASSFVDAQEADPRAILDAKACTAQWLRSLGAEDPPALDPAYEKALAAQAFAAATGALPDVSLEEQKEYALSVKTPEAVRHASAMLSAYDWRFVEQAENIRSYLVSKLMEETENKKPEVRLKAYKMLGEVTEVALFTQRTQIVTKDLSDEEIEREINKRLERLTLNPDTPLVERIDTEVDDIDD